MQFRAIVPFLAGLGLVAHSIYSFLRALRTPSISIQRMRSTSVNGPERHFWRFKFVTEERYVTPQARRSLHITATVLIVLGVLCLAVILMGVLSHSGIASWDKPVAQWMCAHRSPDVTAVMIVLTITSAPVILPVSPFTRRLRDRWIRLDSRRGK